MAQVDLAADIRVFGRAEGFLSGAVDLELSATAAGLFLYSASSAYGAGIGQYRIGAGGPEPIGSASLPGDGALGRDGDLALLSLGGGPVLATTGLWQGGGWVYDAAGDGAFAATGHAIAGIAAGDVLDQVLTVTAGSQRILLASRVGDLALLRYHLDGTAAGSRSRLSLGLEGAADGLVDLACLPETGAAPILLALAEGEALLSSYRIAATGQAVLLDRHEGSEGLGISGPSALELVQVSGQSYAVVAARGSSSLSVFRIGEAGQLSPVDHLLDDPATRFGQVSHLRSLTLDGTTYILAAGTEDGLSLFQLLPGGRLLHLSSMADGTGTALADISAVAMAGAEDGLAIAVSSATEAGLTWITPRIDPQGVVRDGGAGADSLSGTGRADVLSGQAGDDQIHGGAGADVLQDGAGTDRLWGGAGADVFVLSADGSADRIEDFEPGLDRLDLSGWAFLRSSAQLTVLQTAQGAELYFADESLRIITADGRPLTPAQIGAMDLLDGDRMLAGWSEKQAELAAALTGDAGDNLLHGRKTSETLQGLAGNDTILASAGDDRLDGGPGADLLNGGPGSDSFIVDDPGDRVVESRRWAGVDAVYSSVDFWLAHTHVENLTLTGSADIRGIGNGLSNLITGNGGDNILDGGKNNDTLVGGAGDDTYLVRAPGDAAVEQAGAGDDTVKAFRAYALDDHVERLYLQTLRNAAGQGVAGVNGIGNGLDNTIVGNPYDNVIVGREGRDTLKGQGGADSFVFDRKPGPANVDRIIDFNTNEAGEGDLLMLKAAAFGGGLAAGGLDAALFVAGRAAQDADDRFIFDRGSGRLWFDADGSGARDQVLIATFEQHAQVTAGDLLLF